jgi:uncharacterized alkaline shock family protein YloU
MSDEIRLEGLGVAPGVLDTIVKVAAEGVEGVAAVGAPGLAGLVQNARKGTSAAAIDVTVDEDSALTVSVHIQVNYGSRLRDVAEGVQAVVSDALASQVGVTVRSVDVFVDALVFVE